jgi:pantetheine-phosphate adenylyltransferase
VTTTSEREVRPVHGSLAVYPGTFDPFTRGHRDLVVRARMMFDRTIVLVAVNAAKRPTADAAARAKQVRDAIPAAWGDVEVDTWAGLTTAYCVRRGAAVIVRGLRSAADLRHEYQLAAMNEQLGIQTIWLPARPNLAATSSTVVRAYRSAPSTSSR